jgi:hypothetical protein
MAMVEGGRHDGVGNTMERPEPGVKEKSTGRLRIPAGHWYARWRTMEEPSIVVEEGAAGSLVPWVAPSDVPMPPDPGSPSRHRGLARVAVALAVALGAYALGLATPLPSRHRVPALLERRANAERAAEHALLDLFRSRHSDDVVYCRPGNEPRLFCFVEMSVPEGGRTWALLLRCDGAPPPRNSGCIGVGNEDWAWAARRWTDLASP